MSYSPEIKNTLPPLSLSHSSIPVQKERRNDAPSGRKPIGIRDFGRARQHDHSHDDSGNAHKSASYYASIKPEAVQNTEYLSEAEANKVRNIKIDEIVKKANKKLNFLKKDKAKKFEERMKIFENLNTFIDIKDYIQQLNVLNHDTARKNVRLPPLQPISGSSSPYNNTLTHSISTKGKLSRDASPNNRSTGRLPASNFGSMVLTGQNHNVNPNPVALGDRLKAIQSTVSKFAAIKEEEALDIEGKKDVYGMVLDKTNVMLTQLNEVDLKMPVAEDTDINNFYQELQNDLIYNNFEKIDHGNVELQQEEMDYYKNLLAFRDEPDSAEPTDQKYYEDYKARADKVINLLRKAAKNIYKKAGEGKKQVRAKIQTDEVIEEELTKMKTERDEATLKDNLKQEFEMYVSSGGLMNGSMDRKNNLDLDIHYQKMLRKVDQIVKAQEPVKDTEGTPSKAEEEKAGDNQMNHEINKAFKSYMKAILESAEAQGANFKTVKGDFNKKINQLEDAYDKEIQRLLPKTLDSIKMTLDTQMTNKSYLDKPVRKNFSRKMLNALMN